MRKPDAGAKLVIRSAAGGGAAGVEAEITAGVPETEDALLLLQRMDEGFYAVDPEWRVRYVNPMAELFWGLQRADILGRSMFELFPRFAGSPAHTAHEQALRTAAMVRVQTVSTATGRPVELRIFPSAAGLSVFFQDISGRLQLEQELRTREDLLTLAELSAGIGVWVADLKAGTVLATPQFYRLLGLDPIEGPVAQEVPRSVRHPEDGERVSAGFREAMARGDDAYEAEYRIIRPDGEVRWIFGRGRVRRDENGEPWRYSGVDVDITERKKQDEHLQMVMRELLHRTNNMLAVVQGLARQTARGSRNIGDFVSAFNDRLQGLGESNTLLGRQDWRGASVKELVHAQIEPFAEAERFELSGPPVLLTPRAVQNLGLALHELCTNAIKYGALSLPGGKVFVTWTLQGDPQELCVEWREVGGPPVKPPRRAGFGRVVSEKMIASALNAKVETRFDPSGVCWRVVLPEEEFNASVEPPR